MLDAVWHECYLGLSRVELVEDLNCVYYPYGYSISLCHALNSKKPYVQTVMLPKLYIGIKYNVTNETWDVSYIGLEDTQEEIISNLVDIKHLDDVVKVSQFKEDEKKMLLEKLNKKELHEEIEKVSNACKRKIEDYDGKVFSINSSGLITKEELLEEIIERIKNGRATPTFVVNENRQSLNTTNFSITALNTFCKSEIKFMKIFIALAILCAVTGVCIGSVAVRHSGQFLLGSTMSQIGVSVATVLMYFILKIKKVQKEMISEILAE